MYLAEDLGRDGIRNSHLLSIAPAGTISLLAGNYLATARKYKRAISCSSGLLNQMTLAEYMAIGDYDRHLNRLRPVLKQNAQRMSAAVERWFPDGTRVSRPRGGSVLWIELPKGSDSVALFEQALEAGISIVPGTVFAARGRYRNFIRLSFGHPWTNDMDDALQTLGNLAAELVRNRTG